MNIAKLNTASLDDKTFIIKRGTSGGGTINNQEKVVDITENGTTEITPDSNFTGLSKVTVNVEVESSTPSKPKYTGHADAEGLRAIGWTDEDIAYYQENGVNWNEEDDQYHLVTDDNKALYGVLTADNISTYKDRIVYLPKIDTSGVTNMSMMFYNCKFLTAIPQLDTSSVTKMEWTFNNCFSLTTIPPLDTSSVTNMISMFSQCFSLISIPQLDTRNVIEMNLMFYNCHALTTITTLNTGSVKSMNEMFRNCYVLTSIPQLDTSKVTNMNYMLRGCYALTTANLKNVKLAYQLDNSALLSKESLLYIINNEAAESAITITLASYAYDRWATDADVVAALANHPNISLAK